MSESILFSNDLCKRLNEESHNHATISESQRYNAHFDYFDLVRKLNKLKEEREQKTVGSPFRLDLNLVSSKQPEVLYPIKLKKKKKKTLNFINTERINRQKSEKLLPDILSPRSRYPGKDSTTGHSTDNLRISKVSKDFKLQPIKKKYNYLIN